VATLVSPPCRTMAAGIVLAVAALGLNTVSLPAAAQSANPVVPSMIPESVAQTVYARIVTVDPISREVILNTFDGATLSVIAAPQVSLENLNAGDRMDVRYHRSVAFLVAKGTTPGGPATNLPPEQAGLLARREQAQIPDGPSVSMTHIVGLVVGVNPGSQRVDVVNPNGGAVYSIQASDPSRAAVIVSLKVGDVVTAVISPPIATSIEPETTLFSNLPKLVGG
jgi:hypothetical protein